MEVKITKTRIFIISLLALFFQSLAQFIYPTREQCDKHNNAELQKLAKDTEIIKIDALHELVETNKKTVKVFDEHGQVLDKFIPKDDRDCAGLSKTLHLAVWAIVFLNRNIDTTEGLVNGCRGVIMRIDTNPHNDQTSPRMPTKIHVRFFDQRVGAHHRSSHNKEWVEILPVSVFSGKDGFLRRFSVLILFVYEAITQVAIQ